MNVEVARAFEKDVDAIADSSIAVRLSEIIAEIELCNTIRDIPNLKRMVGVGAYYRLRVGNYRIGVSVEGGTVRLMRFLHRKDIYRYFP